MLIGGGGGEEDGEPPEGASIFGFHQEPPTCVSGHRKGAQAGWVLVLSLIRLLVGYLFWLGF